MKTHVYLDHSILLSLLTHSAQDDDLDRFAQQLNKGGVVPVSSLIAVQKVFEVLHNHANTQDLLFDDLFDLLTDMCELYTPSHQQLRRGIFYTQNYRVQPLYTLQAVITMDTQISSFFTLVKEKYSLLPDMNFY